MKENMTTNFPPWHGMHLIFFVTINTSKASPKTSSLSSSYDYLQVHPHQMRKAYPNESQMVQTEAWTDGPTQKLASNLPTHHRSQQNQSFCCKRGKITSCTFSLRLLKAGMGHFTALGVSHSVHTHMEWLGRCAKQHTICRRCFPDILICSLLRFNERKKQCIAMAGLAHKEEVWWAWRCDTHCGEKAIFWGNNEI